MFPLVGESKARGHSLRIQGRSFRKELRRSFFGQRVANLWNSLPQPAVEAKSMDIFKAGIDRSLQGNRVGRERWMRDA